MRPVRLFHLDHVAGARHAALRDDAHDSGLARDGAHTRGAQPLSCGQSAGGVRQV